MGFARSPSSECRRSSCCRWIIGLSPLFERPLFYLEASPCRQCSCDACSSTGAVVKRSLPATAPSAANGAHIRLRTRRSCALLCHSSRVELTWKSIARYVRLFRLLIVGRSRHGASSLASTTQRQLASMRASMRSSVEQLALARTKPHCSRKSVEVRRVAPPLVRRQTLCVLPLSHPQDRRTLSFCLLLVIEDRLACPPLRLPLALKASSLQVNLPSLCADGSLASIPFSSFGITGRCWSSQE